MPTFHIFRRRLEDSEALLGSRRLRVQPPHVIEWTTLQPANPELVSSSTHIVAL